MIASTSVASSGGGDVTTPAIDTTGATIFIAGSSYFAGSGVIADSTGLNTWIPLTAYSANSFGDYFSQLYYAENPVTDASQTFSYTRGGGGYPVLCVAAFSGVVLTSAFDTENGATDTDTSGTSLFTGSVSPANASSLFVANLCLRGLDGTGAQTYSIDNGFSICASQAATTGNSVGGALAYLVGSSAVNPEWTWANGDSAAASIAVFVPSGGGGGGGQPMMRRWGGRSGPVPGIGQSSGGGKAWG